MFKNLKQGKFSPTNPEKYVGDSTNIVYRSGWELRLMKFLDRNPSIIKWCSEEIVIPYFDPSSNKVRRYFVDFAIQYKSKSGETKKVLVEVKPDAQCRQPEKRKKNSAKYLTEVMTYETNKAKWAAADKWCKDRGMEFWVLTEKHLGFK